MQSFEAKARTVETITEAVAIDISHLLNGNFHTPESLQAEQEAGELAKQWKLRTLKDAYQKREPLRYLISDLLPYPSLSVVYGGPGSLKSMLLADMAVCIASGSKWLEAMTTDSAGHTFATSQAPVFWIDFDNGNRRTDERIDAFAKARNLPEDTPIRYISMPTPWLDASKRSMVDDLARLIKSISAKLIIIDNLGLITGDKEENSAEMAQVMGNLRWLCEETDSAIVVVHHQRKSSAADNGARKGETLRGHSSIEAALDLALLVERKDGQDSVAVIPTKVRGYKLTDIFGAQFTYTHVDGTKDLATARFFSYFTESTTDKETRIIKTTILEVLSETRKEIKQSELVNDVRDAMAAQGLSVPGINKVRGILSEMAHNNEIREVQGEKGQPNRALLYDLHPKDRV